MAQCGCSQGAARTDALEKHKNDTIRAKQPKKKQSPPPRSKGPPRHPGSKSNSPTRPAPIVSSRDKESWWVDESGEQKEGGIQQVAEPSMMESGDLSSLLAEAERAVDDTRQEDAELTRKRSAEDAERLDTILDEAESSLQCPSPLTQQKSAEDDERLDTILDEAESILQCPSPNQFKDDKMFEIDDYDEL